MMMTNLSNQWVRDSACLNVPHEHTGIADRANRWALKKLHANIKSNKNPRWTVFEVEGHAVLYRGFEQAKLRLVALLRDVLACSSTLAVG